VISCSLPEGSRPARLGCVRVKFAQSRGECPGNRITLRERVGGADDGNDKDEDALPTGSREGSGPVEGMRRELVLCEETGDGRDGGGSIGATGREGGSMSVLLLLRKDAAGEGADARCAEFKAGNCGGGRLSSSSSSSSSSCSTPLKSDSVGTGAEDLTAPAFGVASGEIVSPFLTDSFAVDKDSDSSFWVAGRVVFASGVEPRANGRSQESMGIAHS
jgi:hypothetical protein